MSKKNDCLTSVFSLLLSILFSRLAFAANNELQQREANASSLREHIDNPVAAFESWRVMHNKTYTRDSQEWNTRYEIWLENLHHILNYNEQHNSHWLTMTSFADLSDNEAKEKVFGFINDNSVKDTTTHSSNALEVDDAKLTPSFVDWRLQDAVTSVKDQGSCGSCWAFSAVGSIEGANALFNDALLDLSVQELVDCDTMDSGCQGGQMQNAFEWVKRNGGLASGQEYKYHGAHHFFCNWMKARDHRVSVQGYKNVPIGEKYLVQALSRQPVSVAVHADHKAFAFYGGGIFDAPCAHELNHGMLAVGYDLERGYFIVKNSWGEHWGEDGYIRLAMLGEDSPGQCGVAMSASYPIIEAAQINTNESKTCETGIHCGDDESCCCENYSHDTCAQWTCCPSAKYYCCQHQNFCCPEEYPICNPQQGYCSNGHEFIAGLRRLSPPSVIYSQKFEYQEKNATRILVT
eukprot:g3844.t1